MLTASVLYASAPTRASAWADETNQCVTGQVCFWFASCAASYTISICNTPSPRGTGIGSRQPADHSNHDMHIQLYSTCKLKSQLASRERRRHKSPPPRLRSAAPPPFSLASTLASGLDSRSVVLLP